MKQATTQMKGQREQLRPALLAVMFLLVAQFIAGMLVNLYTSLPKVHPGTGESFAPSIPWALQAGAGVALAVHVAIAIILLVGSIALTVLAFIRRDKAFMIGASIGLLLVLYAFSNGLNFLNRGGDDRDSLAMALASMFALCTYAVTFYLTRDH